MKIVMIGAGNVATSLAIALMDAGHEIIQVFSRSKPSAEALAKIVGCPFVTIANRVTKDGDLYIFSVKDSVLYNLAASISEGKDFCFFIHTSGSVPMDVFKHLVNKYGVLYPMQTFSKQNPVSFKDIPCFVEGNYDFITSFLKDFASQISSKVYCLSSEERKYLHLSAVFASNFVNHCYAISESILRKHNIPFDVMLPLIDETAAKVHKLSPIDAQTGPAVRKDEEIIREHISLLRDNLVHMNIYEFMSMSIFNMCEPKIKEREELARKAEREWYEKWLEMREKEKKENKEVQGDEGNKEKEEDDGNKE